MKNFEEAVDHILLKRVREGDKIVADETDLQTYRDAVDRYQSLHEEIQRHELTATFVHKLIQIAYEQDLSDSLLLAVAFSHGVMVGQEMNKDDSDPLAKLCGL
jgi:hypothetical protein